MIDSNNNLHCCILHWHIYSYAVEIKRHTKTLHTNLWFVVWTNNSTCCLQVLGAAKENLLKLKPLKTFKFIAIFSYLLIILAGEMIGLPFFIWLLFTIFDFGNGDQIFAFFGVIGLTISFLTLNSIRTFKILWLDIICFILLASPIIRRLTAIPIEKFNYLAFLIPTTIFGLFYVLSLCFSVRQYFLNQKSISAT